MPYRIPPGAYRRADEHPQPTTSLRRPASLLPELRRSKIRLTHHAAAAAVPSWPAGATISSIRAGRQCRPWQLEQMSATTRRCVRPQRPRHPSQPATLKTPFQPAKHILLFPAPRQIRPRREYRTGLGLQRIDTEQLLAEGLHSDAYNAAGALLRRWNAAKSPGEAIRRSGATTSRRRGTIEPVGKADGGVLDQTRTPWRSVGATVYYALDRMEIARRGVDRPAAGHGQGRNARLRAAQPVAREELNKALVWAWTTDRPASASSAERRASDLQRRESALDAAMTAAYREAPRQPARRRGAVRPAGAWRRRSFKNYEPEGRGRTSLFKATAQVMTINEGQGIRR